MRYVTPHPNIELDKTFTKEQKQRLSDWLTLEVTDALSAQFRQQAVWRECLRLYEGVPKNPTKVHPVPGAPNLEVTIGAIATDSIYSQSLDLVFSISPTLTIRAGNASTDDAEDAKALQNFVNKIVRGEAQLRSAAEDTYLDNVQLGTGIFYVPWVEKIKKTRFSTINDRGPIIMYHPVEDFLMPGGIGSDPQLATWVGLRFWPTMEELTLRAKHNRRWDISEVRPAGAGDWVRSQREHLGHQTGGTEIQRKANLYEIWDFYALFDIDEDGIEEDLYVVWDRTAQHVIYVSYNSMVRRPVSKMVYQRRAGLPYGIGVMEMLKPYQEEITETHNHRVLNMLLANSRFWKARDGSVPDNMRIWPGKVQTMSDPEDVQSEVMADVYPSSMQAEAVTISLAERRVGLNESSITRPSQLMSSRTPGITALSFLQQQNKRFTAAFDGMRFATAEAVTQCLARYHERMLAGDAVVAQKIRDAMAQDAERVLKVLSNPLFLMGMEVELTASSASINAEADKQNSMLLVNILAQYYQRTLELVTVAAQPEAPQAVREVATRIANAVGEVIERTVRQFDTVRDPQTFIVEVDDILDGLPDVEGQALSALSQLMSATGAGGASGVDNVPPGGGAGEGELLEVSG